MAKRIERSDVHTVPKSTDETVEYEVQLSELLDLLGEWLSRKPGVSAVREDQDDEPSFYCSGKPPSLTYPVILECAAGSLKANRKAELINDWLLPLLLANLAEAKNGYVVWDSGLTPTSGKLEDNDPNIRYDLRDGTYWILLVRKDVAKKWADNRAESRQAVLAASAKKKKAEKPVKKKKAAKKKAEKPSKKRAEKPAKKKKAAKKKK